MSETESHADDIMDRVAHIVSSYVENNPVPMTELPGLIKAVHASLSTLSGSTNVASSEPKAPQAPAVSIKKSVTPDAITCLEDGKRFKSLRRHLTGTHGMTPDAYRAKWKLPGDYPMVASTYSSDRSKLARSNGLGRKGRPAEPVAAEEPVAPKRGHGRPHKVKAER